MVEPAGRYKAVVGSQTVELPIVEIGDDLWIALLITVDLGVGFGERAGRDLADALRPRGVEVVATAATMGIPVALEVTRALGLDAYIVLHKVPKIHLRDALLEPVRSITTGPEQQLRLDRARLHVASGKRVAFVDDVISTGSSAAAATRLLRQAGADVVAIGALVTETNAWRAALGEDAGLVTSLGEMPIFRRGPGGSLVEDWDG
jgi:adenine phosphoribosyltransferase